GKLQVELFHGDLVNQAGILAPGILFGTTQTLGNYNQLAAATLEIEIGGALLPMHDYFQANGNAILGGQLDVALVNGFVPNFSDQIFILGTNGGDVFNTFANAPPGQRLATRDGIGSFVVNYGPSSVTLNGFRLAPGADFDEDGDVDVDDLTKW